MSLPIPPAPQPSRPLVPKHPDPDDTSIEQPTTLAGRDGGLWKVVLADGSVVHLNLPAGRLSVHAVTEMFGARTWSVDVGFDLSVEQAEVGRPLLVTAHSTITEQAVTVPSSPVTQIYFDWYPGL